MKQSYEMAYNESDVLKKKVQELKKQRNKDGKPTGEDYSEVELELERENKERIKKLFVSIEDLIPDIDSEGLAKEEVEGFSKEYSVPVSISEKAKNLSYNDHGYSQFGKALSTPYAAQLEGSLEEGNIYYNEKAKEALAKYEGKIVVDLGAGKDQFGYMVAHKSRCKAYVAVEPHFAEELAQRLALVIEKQEADGHSTGELKTAVAVVKEDMLNFLKRLSDDSVCILLSGIDSEILSNYSYTEKVEVEVIRVLDPKGIIVKNSSETISPKLLVSESFVGGHGVYKKVSSEEKLDMEAREIQESFNLQHKSLEEIKKMILERKRSF